MSDDSYIVSDRKYQRVKDEVARYREALKEIREGDYSLSERCAWCRAATAYDEIHGPRCPVRTAARALA